MKRNPDGRIPSKYGKSIIDPHNNGMYRPATIEDKIFAAFTANEEVVVQMDEIERGVINETPFFAMTPEQSELFCGADQAYNLARVLGCFIEDDEVDALKKRFREIDEVIISLDEKREGQKLGRTDGHIIKGLSPQQKTTFIEIVKQERALKRRLFNAGTIDVVTGKVFG